MLIYLFYVMSLVLKSMIMSTSKFDHWVADVTTVEQKNRG